LDGLRGVAAIGVMMRHTVTGVSDVWLSGGYLAVDLFFVLSGFVLAHSYEKKFAKGMGVGGFMYARLVRLYPLYIVGMAITVAGVLASWAAHMPIVWTARDLGLAALFNGLFLPSPLTVAHLEREFPLDLPAWSLFFELVINFFYVLTWRWLSNRVLLAICAVGGTVFAMSCFAHGSADIGADWSTFWAGFARIAYSFPAGILIYRTSKRLAPVSVNPWILLVALAVILQVPANGPYRGLYDAAIVLAGFPLLVILGGAAKESDAGRPVFAFLGLTSYAIYVLHVPTYTIAERVCWKLLHIQNVVPWLGFGVVTLVIAGSWVLDRYYDVPVRKWLMGRWRPVPARA